MKKKNILSLILFKWNKYLISKGINDEEFLTCTFFFKTPLCQRIPSFLKLILKFFLKIKTYDILELNQRNLPHTLNAKKIVNETWFHMIDFDKLT